VMIGIHRIEPLEAVRVCYGAKLSDIRRTIRCEFHPERVGASDADQCSCEQIGPLSDGSSYENPAGACAFAGEAFGAGELVIDQVLGAGKEIINRMLLGQLVPGAVPFLAVFSPTTHVSEGDHVSALQPCQPNWIEMSLVGNALSAIADEMCRVVPIQLEVLGADDGNRHHSSVGALGFYLHRLIRGCVDWQRRLNSRVGGGLS